ncbi:AAA domain-containing protein [Anaerovorax odorimutans]|uniref:AAA domain-containing protein n=1 Tax=Anaerovorax odorimutans TaxID=109327 RepID=A0ABT1RLK8_9FIRM|nr:AAA domain-containing protein [Anaerovorax odorimutans]MCQ4636057.1 AAA domain-containing protein [Anaerovorax odorimutans]
MNTVCRDIFKAVHEGKWISIEYKNKNKETTRYWIGINDINLKDRSLSVAGLHLSKHTLGDFPRIYIDSILSSDIVEGSYHPINQKLVEDIHLNPQKYKELFHHAVNMKILNYLADCNRLDSTPYRSQYALVEGLDGEDVEDGVYRLDDQQYRSIINQFQYRTVKEGNRRERPGKRILQICMNLMSVPTSKGLYVLAYRRMNFDVVRRRLIADDEATICREFTIEGEKQSVRRFLPEEYSYLLDDFEINQEQIKDLITGANPHIKGVDDMPYILTLAREQILDLDREYGAILEMYQEETVTVPIKAFFGELVKQPVRKKQYPLALLNQKVNLDQLLAIHHGLKYPLSYIQGPPGTGKTNTIINTITTAFFNEKTVLFASYNNHPIDSVFETLQNIKYRGNQIPFPAVRLGNREKVEDALDQMKELYLKVKEIKVFSSTLERNRDDKIEKTRQLSQLLKRYEEILDLKERKESIESLISSEQNLTFRVELQSRQLKAVEKRIQEIGEVHEEDALPLLNQNEEEFLKYLYYISAKYIKRLDEPKNEELLDILLMEGPKTEQVKEFNRHLSQEENLKKFLRIFPVVITTCISAHRLGEPKPYFDMVIMDEASQCNSAVSLVPIIRGKNLMLVGDPQQLSPVIVLDPKANQTLKNKYGVSKEYDYIENSIYKTYLACDSVSDEILLSYHYRCHEKIIGFNNKKYYNDKLKVRSQVPEAQPLVYMDLADESADGKNTAPAEAEQILEYILENRDKKIGVITPFVSQKEYINSRLEENGIRDIQCGTVHAFQGDEKDVILFSLAVTDQTHVKTYNWLKNNKELINVATSRAKEKLVLLSSSRNLSRLHGAGEDDDLYELIQYIRTNGTSQVTPKAAATRALGIKPYSTQTEAAFLTTLNHALSNILVSGSKYTVHREVPISHVFNGSEEHNDLFYTGSFDFVVYERSRGRKEMPVLAIELDGKEHIEDEAVRHRDQKKNELCQRYNFELIRVENSYARRYNYMKDILIEYFKKL